MLKHPEETHTDENPCRKVPDWYPGPFGRVAAVVAALTVR